MWVILSMLMSKTQHLYDPFGRPTAMLQNRVDPSISNRLSLTERERLYDKVVRDARQLEMQGAQLRRLSILLRPACRTHRCTKI